LSQALSLERADAEKPPAGPPYMMIRSLLGSASNMGYWGARTQRPGDSAGSHRPLSRARRTHTFRRVWGTISNFPVLQARESWILETGPPLRLVAAVTNYNTGLSPCARRVLLESLTKYGERVRHRARGGSFLGKFSYRDDLAVTARGGAGITACFCATTLQVCSARSQAPGWRLLRLRPCGCSTSPNGVRDCLWMGQ
jgi:hypothetical protein